MLEYTFSNINSAEFVDYSASGNVLEIAPSSLDDIGTFELKWTVEDDDSVESGERKSQV